MASVPTDIEIAQAATPRPIAAVAAELGLGPDEILPYGHTKAKITMAALRARTPRGKLVLVTGRELGELMQICPPLEIFDRVVAENGALLYRPRTREEVELGDPPPREFSEELIRRGAERVSSGRVALCSK